MPSQNVHKPAKPRKRPAVTVKKTAVKKRNKSAKKVKISPWWIVGLVCLLALSVIVPHWLYNSNPDTGAPVPEGYRHFMLDLSHHNPREVAWDSLKVVIDSHGNTSKDLSGAKAILPLSHVVMKATEGESLKDKHFENWWQEAGEAGLSRGAYHFFRSSKDAGLQAQQYIERVTLTHKDLPPILDIETVHNGCTREQLCSKALVWLRMVEEHYGRTPIVYTSDSFVKDWLNKSITDYYPLWIARYNKQEPRTQQWLYWQFTDEAVVYGIKGKVDLSVLR